MTIRPNSPTEDRWLTPDPLGGDITNPQSLNRYAYALNNPTTLTDPSGLDSCWNYGSYEGSGSPPGVAPEDVIRTVGQAGAMSYAMAKGLSYPLKSSIYRGILGETEIVAGVVTLVPVIYEEGKALNNERKSFEAGICQ